jgi:quinol monooxygenase YgiN
VTRLVGIARCKFHEGKLAEFERMCDQAMEIVGTKDPGTLQYDILTPYRSMGTPSAA